MAPSPADDALPTVSVVIPVYNSAWVLGDCLERVRTQDYPADKVEIILADGGSSDGTLELAAKMGVRAVFDNPLRTGEAGKAVGILKARNDIIALIDSDNLLPDPQWLRRMVEPFADPEVFASEPWEYLRRAEDSLITRYCALLGMNDPLCYFLGNYDRRCVLSGRWTGLELQEMDRGGWIKVSLREDALPTIGANGFLIRRADLLATQTQPYLFDIDCVYDLVRAGRVHVAKVKVGIIHLYCRGFGDFVRKQRRRIRDYLYYQKHAQRRYPWASFPKARLAWFIVATVLVLPTLLQALVGWVRSRDAAMLFHPLACLATLAVYASGVVRARLGKSGILDRGAWGKP
ncbi:MAG TPA: glycosyltransferase [bacterium]|jgi:glycosyltransferase involved in cell wall biosynthesis|nr:glycosyltransferase [bacterium]